MSAALDIRHLQATQDDMDEVQCALAVASRMWSTGDHQEALKWLRRAATTAADGGADRRAVQLFKLAADAKTRLERPRRKKTVPRAQPVRPRKPRKTKSGERPAVHPLARAALRATAPAVPRPTASNKRVAKAPPRLLPDEEATRPHVIAPAPRPRQVHPLANPQTTARYDDLEEVTDVMGAAELDAKLASELPTIRKKLGSAPSEPHRVAVYADPDSGEPCLMFVPAGEPVPPGAAVAMLVPPTTRDASLLMQLYPC